MASFEYASAGGGPTGTIEAPDRASAVRLLRARGVTPTRLTTASGDAPSADNHTPTRAPSARAAGPGKLRGAEVAELTREMATALNAGLPVTQTLKVILGQARSERRKSVVASMLESVEHGSSLADAAANAPGAPFGQLVVGLMRAGEASGKLGETLDHAAELLDRRQKLQRALLSATLYPMILVGLVVIAMVIVVTIIVPRVLEPLAGQISASDLPLPTRVVQFIAWFVAAYWWAILGVIAAVVLGVRAAMNDAQSRLGIDRAVLKTPLVGRLARDVAVARLSRTLATLIGAGVPAVTALRVSRDSVGNTAMREALDDVVDKVSHGSTIADPMEQSGLFPPLLTQIIGLGERTGRLGEMLRRAAGAFEERAEATIGVVATALPPMLVVIVAGAIGFVVAAILLPMLQMQEMMSDL